MVIDMFVFLLFFLFSFGFTEDREQEPTTPPPSYDPRLTLSAFYENKDKSFFEGDLLIPLLQSNHFIFFGNVRGLNRKKKEFEWNAGIGTRFILDHDKSLFGAYGFFDRKRTDENHFFNQLSFGVEWRKAHYVITSNAYFPIGKKRKRAKKYDKSFLIPANLPKLYQISFVQGQEIALYGFDIEWGVKILHPLFVYVGGYYFNADTTRAFFGPRGRVELIYQTKQRGFIPLSKIILEGVISYDRVRKTKVYAGLRFSFDLGDTRQNVKRKGMQKWMTSYVRRDYDIVVEGNTQEPFSILTENTQPVTVNLCENEADFDQGLLNANVIALQNDLTFNSTKNLQSNQTITSKYFIFGEDQKILLGPGNKTITSTATNLFSIMENNTLRDLKLMVNEGDFLFSTTQSIGNLQLEKLHSNAKVLIDIQDGTQNSSLSVNACVFDLTTTGNHTLFDLKVSQNSQLATQFNSNTLKLTADEGLLISSMIENRGQITMSEMMQNTFEIIGNQNQALYFNIQSTIANRSAQMTIGQIAYNTFHFYQAGKTEALVFQNNHTTVNSNHLSTIQIESISNNTIYFHDQTFGSNLVFQNLANFTANQQISCQTISENTFTFDQTHSNSIAMSFLNEGVATQNIVIGNEGGLYFNQTHFNDDTTRVGTMTLNNNTPSTIVIFVNYNDKSLSKANFNANILESGNSQDQIQINLSN